MLRLVMITFDDMPAIVECLESVKDYVDEIVCIDGRFDTFPREPGVPAYSTDGTIEYIAGLETEKIVAVVPELSEVEKRNRYLIGDPGDWYLHLDSDEWVENPELLKDLPDVDVCICPMRRDNGHLDYYPRLFRHVDGMRYEGLHHRLVDEEGKLIADINGVGNYRSQRFPLMIRHDRSNRTKERWKQKEAYYRILTEREKEYKEMLRYGC